MSLRITLADADCDRCGKHTTGTWPYSVLWPFKLAESIIYRRRVIAFPWLCPRCMMIEKKRWWAAARATGTGGSA